MVLRVRFSIRVACGSAVLERRERDAFGIDGGAHELSEAEEEAGPGGEQSMNDESRECAS